MLTPPGNRRLRTARPTSLFALEAQKHLAAGRPKQAVEVCKMGLIYYPEHVTGYVVLAKAFLALDKIAQAVNVLRDGYRRTGVEQLELLRAEISGEIPTREKGRSIDRSSAQTLRRARPLGASPRLAESTEPEQEPEIFEPAPHSPPARVPVEQPSEPPVEPEAPVEEPANPPEPIEPPVEPEAPIEEPDRPALPAELPPVAPVPVEEPPAAPVPVEEPEAPQNEPVRMEEPVEISDRVSEDLPLQSIEPAVEIEKPVETESPELELVEDFDEQFELDLDEDFDERFELEPGIVVEIEIESIEIVPEATSEEAPEDAPPIATDVESAMVVTAAVMLELEEEMEMEPATSLEMREALDETLPTFVTGEAIPELKAPAFRIQDPAQADRETVPDRGRSLSLAIHSRMNVTRLRSSNLRLIPGLEFAPLRHEDQQRRQSIAPLIDETVPLLDLPDRLSRTGDAPPLPSFGIHAPVPLEEVQEEVEILPAPTGTFSLDDPPPVPRSFHNRPEPREGELLTPLEELARRLEKARIPVVEEAEPRHAFEPSIVSDTFASILVAQGAYAEALKAYQTLARTKPERYEFYQHQIQDMQERILNEEDDESESE